MKIVYFGTDVFLSCFLYFAEHHQILGLYTYHNDEDYFTEYSIVREAKRMGIPVHYEDMTKEETCRYFLEQGCQLFLWQNITGYCQFLRDLTALEGSISTALFCLLEEAIIR